MDSTAGYPDVAIIGSGINKINEMTLESWRLLNDSEAVVTNLNDSLAIEFLSDELDADLYDFSSMYDPHDEMQRHDTYYEIIMTVLELGEEIDGLVSYLSVGHPSVYSFTPTIVKQVEEEWGLDVEIFPGVSTADKLFASLGVDPGRGGVLQYNFSEAVRNNMQISEKITFIGWLFGRFHDEGLRPEEVTEYLASQYSTTTYVYIARLSKNIFNSDAIMKIRVQDIEDYPHEVFRGSTIIVFGDHHRELHMEDDKLELSSWTDENVETVMSGEPREQKTNIEPTSSKLREKNEDEIIEFIQKAYKDDDFYRKVINEPEEAISQYDIPEDMKKAVLEKRVQKSDERIDTLLDDIVPNQLGQDPESISKEESESENNQ